MSETPETRQQASTDEKSKPEDTKTPPNGTSTNGTVTIEAQLAEVQAKAAEYLDGWQRARADFANYKKRAEKERDDLMISAGIDTWKKLLPVIDDLDRAVSALPEDKQNDDLLKGFILIQRKLMTLLDNAGVKVVNPVGEEFNPTFHEAIGQDDSDTIKSGHVTLVLQKGYLFGDRILRPALVRVAR